MKKCKYTFKLDMMLLHKHYNEYNLNELGNSINKLSKGTFFFCFAIFKYQIFKHGIDYVNCDCQA